MRRVVGIGAGGHAKVMIDAIKSAGIADIVGLLDRDPARWGTLLLGIKILGGDELLPELRKTVAQAFVGVGGIGNLTPRRTLFETLLAGGFELIDVRHPAAIVSPFAATGRGLTVLAGAVINAGAHVGDNVIINTGAIIEHDCVIGDHAHVATGGRLAGGVMIGSATHIGAGAIVREGVKIGDDTVIGAGSVVVKDVPGACVAYGVPAVVRERR